jgi:hypothetical protein
MLYSSLHSILLFLAPCSLVSIIQCDAFPIADDANDHHEYSQRQSVHRAHPEVPIGCVRGTKRRPIVCLVRCLFRLLDFFF